MKNKFWLENLKSMIAMGVVGVIVLGLLYWKFFMDTGPPPPQYYMPPPPPPPPPAADAGGNRSFHKRVRLAHKPKKQLILTFKAIYKSTNFPK